MTAAVFSITVTWEQVQCVDRNGNITEYMLYYHSKESGENITHMTNMTGFIIMRLQPLTNYVIGVAAVNNAGIGAFERRMVMTLTCKYIATGVCVVMYLTLCS